MNQLKLLKDVDFQNFHNVLELAPEHAEELQYFFLQAIRDTLFLRDLNLMDYSLLLVIVNRNQLTERDMQRLKSNSYYFYSKNRGFLITMGIIDYL